MDKKSYILEKLVEEYIKVPEPVSSKQLQKSLDLSLSSATIRYYFQKLSQNGAITQPHISSGRVPTVQTLKDFWKKRLEDTDMSSDENILKKLEHISQKEHIFCEVTEYKRLFLNGVHNYDNRFLICDFENEDFILPYNKNLERFFSNQIGQEGLKLSQICNDIGLINISKSLKRFLTRNFSHFMLKEVIEIANEDMEWANRFLPSLLDGTFMYNTKKGLKFYNSILTFKFSVNQKNSCSEVLLVGRVYRNYLKLINQLKGE